MMKEQAIKEMGRPSHQQAIVDVMSKKPIKPIKYIIPGGKYMAEQLDKERIKSAVYNWLRKCRDFTQVSIWLTSNPELRKKRSQKAQSFRSTTMPQWHIEVEGKKKLAHIMAEFLGAEQVIGLTATAEGLTVVYTDSTDFSPESEDWEPWIEFIPMKRR